MTELRIKEVSFVQDAMSVTFNSGTNVVVSLVQFERLRSASTAERNEWELIGDGIGVHWPKVDEDLSVENILTAYSRSKRSAYAPTSTP